jgi:predicted ribosome quality control (RQC) complex YloA/Tae2 family protein
VERDPTAISSSDSESESDSDDSDNDDKSKSKQLKETKTRVELDIYLSAFANAQQYFDMRKSMKVKQEKTEMHAGKVCCRWLDILFCF